MRLSISPIGRVHLSAYLLALGQGERTVASVVGKKQFEVIQGHRDFPLLLEQYREQREELEEDFAISVLRGLAISNFLHWIASDHPTASLRATAELLDRIGLPSMSKTVEKIVADSGSRLTLVEERRTLELTGVSDTERARLVDKLIGVRGESLLRLDTVEGANP